MEKDYYNLPISVVDASSMFRKVAVKNTRPYTAKVIKLNNRMVDNWEKVILRPMAKNGKIPSGRVWTSWKLYYEGKNIHQYFKIRKMCPRVTSEQRDFWIKLFEESSIEELHSYGVGVIGFGCGVIEDEIRFWSADENWDKILSS